jgi:hypothetical protein
MTFDFGGKNGEFDLSGKSFTPSLHFVKPQAPACRVEWDGEVLFSLESPRLSSGFDLSAADAMLKKYFLPRIREQLNNQTLLLNMLGRR